jgi:hypothetical protein
MKTSIPESLKASIPPGWWGKVLGVTPVFMTVVATLLAGLSSSEMTSAQYDRSLAAQLQSKAGDQWNFFQGKKLRSAVQHSSVDQILSASPLGALDRAELERAVADSVAGQAIATLAGRQALDGLLSGAFPKLPPLPSRAPAVEVALTAVERAQPEAELEQLLAKVEPTDLEHALQEARANALGLDTLTKPIGDVTDLLEKQLTKAGASDALRREVRVARIDFNAQRYEAEANLNQVVANLYELQVTKSNLSAERHHRRSARFFYGMLAAQAGVVVSTLAMAARQKNLLWGLAAAAGCVAIAFAVHVYLFV